MKHLLISSAFCYLFAFNAMAQVPPIWDTARTELTAKLNLSNAAIEAKWDHQPYCTNFASNLMLANSSRGYGLFTPDPTGYPYPIPLYQTVLYAKIDTMLMAFDTMGYTAVDLTLQYPLLVDSFPNKVYYMDFYKKVVQKIHSRGLKLIIGCQASFVDSTFGEPHLVNDIRSHYFNPDHNPATDDTLDILRYKREKLQMMQTIIDSIAPDFLTLEMEPQTQELNLFHLIDYSVDSTVALVNYFTSNLHTATTLLGAGAGTWDNRLFFERIAATNVDYIDYHVYPPHANYIDNMVFIIDSLAEAYHKKLVIGESWCYKATNNEMSTITDPVATSAPVYSRDVFDYWVGVDTLFVKAMVLLSQQSKVELVQFHWPNVMFGQLVYNPAVHGSMSPAQILNAGQLAGYDNMFHFSMSPVGAYTQALIDSVCILNPDSVAAAPQPGSRIFVYPNPAGKYLKVDAGNSFELLSLYDMTGNLVWSFHHTTQPLISLPDDLANGLYILKILNKNSVYTQRLVIEK
jgi:hypothetical protein